VPVLGRRGLNRGCSRAWTGRRLPWPTPGIWTASVVGHPLRNPTDHTCPGRNPCPRVDPRPRPVVQWNHFVRPDPVARGSDHRPRRCPRAGNPYSARPSCARAGQKFPDVVVPRNSP
jgi:hypothetical protein